MGREDPFRWRTGRASPTRGALVVSRRRSEREDLLLVRTEDPRLAKALSELLFEADSETFSKSFPAGSLTGAIYERFAQHVDMLLRQTAGLERVPWEAALEASADRLVAAGARWWLTGSTALAIRGVPVSPRDIDLVLDDAGAATAARAFEDVLIEPALPVEGWICRAFGRAFLHARVEWIAGVREEVDDPHPTDFGPVAEADLEDIRWRGFSIPVPPVALQRDAAVRRTLNERVGVIDAWLGGGPLGR